MTSPLALVVDDDDDIRLLVELALTSFAGWRVVTATDGREAVAAAREHRPSVVLMDVMMPEMDGLAAAATLLGDPATADIPIVLVTAKLTVPGEPEPWADLAVAGVIAKPFDPVGLADQVRVLVGW
ncbi:CheY-like chemotaxis protein [Nocardioides zeae]|uniref:CheY-like chemotaxis protein n=2 Tax=Nocardioides zeae TaxID=1457234 RepID=A0AAJ1U1R6_9ACTN|nr:response regulator [Nocardioides zeae]MDQ1105995.1 CheY-like chemotaxis protein [Nocardioides zeae]MDR6174361.1 CheY-like chemotaxis protein [Nocardioides zeae]MDR6209166.1 CheY-like chemotaxis protein [Nocardioides zeae]